jgi:hypothetical protein
MTSGVEMASRSPDRDVPPYQLTVEGFAPGHLRVLSFTGKEAISEAWSFDVVVTAHGAASRGNAALGRISHLLHGILIFLEL